MRVGSPNDRWFLPAAEVERIAAASGIPPQAAGSPPTTILGGIVAGLAVIGIALALLVWAMRPRSATWAQRD